MPTATGSVAARMVPKSKPSINGIWNIVVTAIPIIRIVIITPIIAKKPIGTASFFIYLINNLRPDSKIKIGIITYNIISGVLSIKL